MLAHPPSAFLTAAAPRPEGSLAQGEVQVPVLESGFDSAMNALDVLLYSDLSTTYSR